MDSAWNNCHSSTGRFAKQRTNLHPWRKCDDTFGGFPLILFGRPLVAIGPYDSRSSQRVSPEEEGAADWKTRRGATDSEHAVFQQEPRKLLWLDLIVAYLLVRTIGM